MFNKYLVLALALLATTTGCYAVRFTFDPTAPGSISRDVDARWYHNAIYGLAELSEPLRLDEICPEGVQSIDQEQSFVNLLVQGITADLYNPSTVTVFCVGGKTTRLNTLPP